MACGRIVASISQLLLLLQPFNGLFSRTTWYGLTRVVLDKGPLNGRVCVLCIILTADGDIAVLPADVRFDGVAPRLTVDPAGVAARAAGPGQHGRRGRAERVPMRVLVGPALARQTALRHVHRTAVVAAVARVALH